MQEADIEVLWDALKKAALEVTEAEQRFKIAREALVSRLCVCYREDEEWENRAIWCSTRLSNKCPYYLGLNQRQIRL